MRLWIAGGGTGGHVYPGLAVVQAAAAATRADDSLPDESAPDMLYIGGAGKVEQRLAQRAGLPFFGIPAGGIHGLPFWKAILNLTKLTWGWLAVLWLGLRDRPAALFATGGYASVPVALAAWFLRVPILLYLPDIVPGWAVRFIGRLATRVAVTVDDAAEHFPAHKTVVTGYPVRGAFHDVERAEARAELGLSPDEPAVLVMGGSIGAQGINRPLGGMLEQVLPLTQVVHITGQTDWPWAQTRREALPAALQARYHIYEYMHHIEKAFAAVDLIICRAGASILGELPFFGLPAVLVPYPHAWDYQRINADWLTERGAAVCVAQEALDEALLPLLRGLFADPGQLKQMAQRMRAQARPQAARHLADEWLALARQGAERGY